MGDIKISWYANLAAVLAGLTMLILVEIGLQVVGTGPSNRLFVLDRENDRDTLSLNPHVAHRFFQHQYVRLSPIQSRFARGKAPGTYRIFALGASTLLGYPNPPRTSFAHFLQMMLEDVHEGREFEVINCGITAINTFCVLDFVEEVLEYEPDLLVIYSGHNEFVGPYGVTTPFVRFGNNWSWIRFHMLLQRSKIYYYLKELLFFLQSGELKEGRDFGLHLVRREVELESAEHQVTEENFRRNLQEIAKRAGERGVPVMFSTLISNLRGFHPLRSQAPHPRLEGIGNLDSLPERVGYCDTLLRDFPQHAAAHFAAGEVFYKAGAFSRALQAFIRARDLDTIHFRACSPFNQIIREVASERAAEGSILVDMEELFSQASPDGITGDELITEYLHPTVFGHFLMARSMVQTAIRNREIVGLKGGESERIAEFAEYTRRLGYSARERVHHRNNLILFLQNMPYEERPRVLRERLAALVSLQLVELLKLSYGEIRGFARKGGVYFLARTIELLDPADRERLRAQLTEVVGPLGIDPDIRPVPEG